MVVIIFASIDVGMILFRVGYNFVCDCKNLILLINLKKKNFKVTNSFCEHGSLLSPLTTPMFPNFSHFLKILHIVVVPKHWIATQSWVVEQALMGCL